MSGKVVAGADITSGRGLEVVIIIKSDIRRRGAVASAVAAHIHQARVRTVSVPAREAIVETKERLGLIRRLEKLKLIDDERKIQDLLIESRAYFNHRNMKATDILQLNRKDTDPR